jgi:pimeloyl-ACP methyl ester carboxylesterase
MEVYGKIGRLLERQGFLVISLDLPCHGEDARRHEAQELEGWAARLGNGEDIVGEFNKRASRVLDYLIARRCTDPQKVAVCGTSRGGFMAIHWMASEPRVRCVVAFAPVTRLPILREFAALEAHPAVRSLALESLAAKLAGRPIWVTIGNQDTRVGTDSVISFTRHIVKASMAASRPADVELHVMPIVGHTTHPTAHDEAAAWILARIQARR